MSDREPLVSVVMPTNRSGPWLELAVSSALAQSMSDLEVVVVDDGAPGGVAQLERLDSRVRVIRSLGRGAAMARNSGIGVARGTYVAVLDDDDIWMADKLSYQVDRLEARPDAALCHCQFEYIDAAGRVTSPGWAGPVEQDALVTGLFPVAHPTTVWRRDVLDLVGGYSQALWPAEDLDLLLKVLQRWPVVFESATLVQYRWHGANVSADLARQYEAASRALRFRIGAAVARAEIPPTRLGRAPQALRRVRRTYLGVARDEVVKKVRAGQIADAACLALWAAREDPVVAAAVLGERGFGYLARRVHRITVSASTSTDRAQS